MIRKRETKFKSVFQSNAKTKKEKRNSYPFFKVMRKRKTKTEIHIRFSKRCENEIRSSKPFFKSSRKRKTKSKIQICFSMSCENEKWKWHLYSLFPGHRKTVGSTHIVEDILIRWMVTQTNETSHAVLLLSHYCRKACSKNRLFLIENCVEIKPFFFFISVLSYVTFNSPVCFDLSFYTGINEWILGWFFVAFYEGD